MNRILRYGLSGAGLLAGVAAAAIAYVAVTYDPNDLKPMIIEAVKERQHRDLRMDGDIKLTFFPTLGADIGKLSLSEFNSEKQFIFIENVHVSLAVLPLLLKQVVVDEVVIQGLRATLVKYQDGKSNIDDLTGAGAGQPEATTTRPPVLFDIASVQIEDTELHYLDQSTGQEYSLSRINLKTGRIADGVPSDIELSARIEANQPKLILEAMVRTSLTFELESNHYQVTGLDLQMNGTLDEFSELGMRASGDASANLNNKEFKAIKLQVAAAGKWRGDRFETKLDMPAMNLGSDGYSSDKVALNVMLERNIGKIEADIDFPGIEGNAESFKIGAFTVAVKVKQPVQTLDARLTSPFTGNLDTLKFELPKFKLAMKAAGEQLPNKEVSSEMNGNLQVGVRDQTIRASISGGLLQSRVAANFSLSGFEKPVVRFDAEVDQFDSTLYTPESAASAGSAKNEGKAEPASPDRPFDFSGLRELDLEGGLRIGSLKFSNVSLEKVRMGMSAHHGQLEISPLSANLYHGNFNGSITVNAQQPIPLFTIKQNMNGVDVGGLLKDAADLDTVTGRGSVTFNISTRGNTVAALKKSLDGQMALNVNNAAYSKDGKIYRGEVQGKVKLEGGKQRLQADVSGKLDASKFTAKVNMRDFDSPEIRFDAALDRLDLDHYLPQTAKAAVKPQTSAPEEPFDLTALQNLNAEGGLRIGSFKVMNMKLAQVRLDMTARKGMVSVNPLSAKLYQGSMNGSITVNANSTPSFTIDETLNNVAIAPMIKDLMDLDAIEGKGNVLLSLGTQGNLVSTLKKGLNGDASVNLENGAIKGINLTKLMQNAQSIGKGATTQTLGVTEDERTEFSEFRASFKVNNGVAHNEDLSVQSPQLKVIGRGDIDIGNESIDYNAKAMLQQVEGSDYLMVPVRLRGTFADLKYELDYTGMLEDLARRKLEKRAQELKNKAVDDAKSRLQDELQKGLKGLFK